MCRSVSRRTALAATLTICLLVSEPAIAWSAPIPTPTPPTGTVPGPQATSGEQVSAPIVDIQGPVQDIFLLTGDADGTSLQAESSSRIELTLAADVLFAFGKADLSPATRARLDEIAERLRTQAKGTVQIDGHTDSVGDDAQNLTLSRRRAQAVRDALTAALVDGGVTYEINGFGETRPVAPNTVDGKDNPKGRASNRRVEIRFDK
ncbi:OmpA family protein [Micromonospora sp. NPDC053740]|uniref:OmpA family protein n=1 Tax=Micromonospora TaxID=1873 RepID=UPI001EE8A9B8|nr:OmpA family protein [Micromonospora alfalfae]MCG5461914.1 OmpA family protein [Micromonospora alfalfae]